MEIAEKKYCEPTPFHIQSISCLFNPKPTKAVDKDRVLAIVCRHFGVTLLQIKHKTRGKREIAEARHTAMYFLSITDHKLTYKAIGALFQRNHTNVTYAYYKVLDMVVNKDFKMRFDYIVRDIKDSGIVMRNRVNI